MEAKYEKRSADFQCRVQDGTKNAALQCTPHLHYHVEFFILKEGSTTVFIDSVEYRMEAGDLCLVFPNQIHQFRTLGPEKYTLIIFNPDIVPELDDVFITNVPECAVLKNAAALGHINPLIDEIADGNEKEGQYKDVIIKGCLLSLFGEIFTNMKLTEIKSGDSHALKTVVNYCSRNFSKDLSLGILEEELHISKYYISHLFSQKLKVRFNDYINSLRISDACRQLRQTDKTITEISECVGFNTLRTFNRAFTRQKGMSPSEYRRLNPPYAASVSMPV